MKSNRALFLTSESAARLLTFLAFPCALGCTRAGSSSSGQGQDADIAEYEELAKQLDGARKVVEKKGGYDLATAADLLFWVDASAADNPILHSLDGASQQRTQYGFTIFMPLGKGTNTDKGNFQASSTIIASMNEPDGASLYAVGQENQMLGKLTLPAPPYGQRWWAYTVSSGDLYVALQKPNDTRITLQRWAPGDAAPSDVLVFDDLIAPNKMEEFIDFRIDGAKVVFDDHGRFWMADLAGGKAKWVQNDQEIGALAFDDKGAIYDQQGTFYRYDFASDTRESIDDKLRANPYAMNETFASSHLPSQGGVTWCLRGSTIIYTGNDGLFAYDYVGDEVTPILLEPRGGDVTIRYIRPVVTASGTIYVTGLESKTGSTGADGPIVSVPAP